MPCQILPNFVVYEPSINCYIYSNPESITFSPDLYKFCMYNTNTISLRSIQTWKHHLFFKFVQTLPVQYQSHFPYIMSLALYTMALMRGPWLALLWFIVDGIWSKRRDEWTVQASYDKVHTYINDYSPIFIYTLRIRELVEDGYAVFFL